MPFNRQSKLPSLKANLEQHSVHPDVIKGYQTFSCSSGAVPRGLRGPRKGAVAPSEISSPKKVQDKAATCQNDLCSFGCVI